MASSGEETPGSGNPRRPWVEVDRRLQAGRRVAVVWVVAAGRHSPGTTGASMWLDDTGEGAGTVGGGIMESRLQARLRASWQAPSFFEVRTLSHRRDRSVPEGAEPSGLICAGEQTNMVYLCRPEIDAAALRELAAWDGPWTLDERGPRIAAPSAWPAAAPAGADRWYDAAARAYWQRPPRARVAVVGAGHCGLALARLLVELEFRVSLWDERAERLDVARRFGGVELHQVEDFSAVGEGLDDPARTSVVVMTPDVQRDVDALVGVVRREAAFVGAMGSAAKRAEIFRRLRDLGLSSRQIASITAPVGLAIGSRTPAEIAVSVAAQLVARRHGRSRAPDSQGTDPPGV